MGQWEDTVLVLNYVPYTTRFSLARIFAKASYYGLGQKFHQSRELPSFHEVVGGARELLCHYGYAHMYVRMCQNFHYAKKLAKIFSWRKFPH